MPLPPCDTLQNERLVALDAWLDNIMANVPELALCLESKGLVRACHLVATDEVCVFRNDSVSQKDRLPSPRRVTVGPPRRDRRDPDAQPRARE